MKRLVVNKNHFKDVVTTQSGKVFVKENKEDATKLKSNPKLEDIDLKEDYELRRLMEQRIIVVSTDGEEVEDTMKEAIIKEQKSKKNDKETQEALDKIKDKEKPEEVDENKELIDGLTSEEQGDETSSEQDEDETSEEQDDEVKDLK